MPPLHHTHPFMPLGGRAMTNGLQLASTFMLQGRKKEAACIEIYLPYFHVMFSHPLHSHREGMTLLSQLVFVSNMPVHNGA
jgi:hypothetical protein